MEYIVGLSVLIVVFMVGYFATSRKYRRLYFWSIFPQIFTRRLLINPTA